ncbi:stage V sporulation protein T [Faecalimonas sp.]
MKATGIVRRIDDLGRVVIPKEIRRTLRIREGDPLEIFTDRNGEVILKKYSPIGELYKISCEYTESLSSVTGYTVCVADTEQIVAVSGSGKKTLTEKRITSEMRKIMDMRNSFVAERSDKKYIQIAEVEMQEYTAQAISPIICEGDVIGAVILLNKSGEKKFGDLEKILTQTGAGFLGKQMEQ